MDLYAKILKNDQGDETITSNRCSLLCIDLLWHEEKEEAWFVYHIIVLG